LQKQKATPFGDVLFLAAGELAVSAVTVLVFYLIGRADFRVILGCLAGSAVTVLNFLILSVSVSRAIDRVMAGQKEALSEEAAAAFAAEHSAEIQKAVKASYLVRQILMIAVLVIGCVLKIFNVIAAVIPLLVFRPLLTLREVFRQKKQACK
jgi:hypothetical protein